MNVTPHDIAALAETRRRDPDLALWIAEQSGKAHDTAFICRIPQSKEQTNERPGSADRRNAR